MKIKYTHSVVFGFLGNTFLPQTEYDIDDQIANSLLKDFPKWFIKVTENTVETVIDKNLAEILAEPLVEENTVDKKTTKSKK